MPRRNAAAPSPGAVPHRLWRASLALLGTCGSFGPAMAATLPVPCLIAGSCGGSSGPLTWVSSGSAALSQSGNVMTIRQSSENAVLNWQSFNISNDGTVTFRQPDAAAVALNQIFQADPSKILGALNANGSIYLINQNGIIFGAGAQVNTGTLIASSLNMSPSALSGILNAGLNSQAAFTSFVDASGNPLPSGPVQVAAGASINAPGGEIMLFAPQVTNKGSLNAAGGQVILAAGDSVYLAASTDPNLRGLLVEVGHGGTVTNAAASSPGGSDYGQISAADGNVSLVGLYVNQLGRVSASTAVQQNGSIYLLAQDGGSATAVPGATSATLLATNAGTLTLGAGSQTDVTLDLGSTSSAVDATAQPKSQVTLVGQAVTLAGGSEITATSGNVSITASAVPGASPDTFSAQPGSGRLLIDSGASIDVSGANISLPMSSNVIPVQLRATELADSPEQRNGPLYGQTVYVDIRQTGVLNGTSWVGSPIGDLSGYVSAIQRTVGERNLTGGTITLNSDGAAFVAPEATLNISGGSINYLPGYLNTTKLLGTNGLVYDISQANPAQSYVGILSNYSVTDPKWGVTQNYPSVGSADPQGQFEAGYVEGKDAGALTIAAPRLVLDADVTADTVIGSFQRQLPGAFDSATSLYRPVNQMPLGGQLILGLADGSTTGDDYLLPDVVFATGGELDSLTGPTGAAFNPLSDPLPAALDTVRVRPDLFGTNGISQLSLYANGTVSIPAGIALQLPVDGALALTAGAIDLAGSVTAHAGSVSLKAVPTQSLPPGAAAALLTLEPQAVIDVSGNWINDQPNPYAAPSADPLGTRGGKVTLSASGGTPLDLEAGSLVNASGGAQRTMQGQIVGGAAGSISISETPSSAATVSTVTLGSTLKDYGLTQGGSLSISANALCIAIADCSGGQSGTLWIPAALFSADGFASISLSSNLGGVDLLPGTQIRPQQMTYALQADPATVPSGVPFQSLAAPALLPALYRSPVSVSLGVEVQTPPSADFDNANFATAGILNIGTGAAITLDPKASLRLSSNTSIVIDGSLSAPAGTISIATNTSLPIAQFLDAQGIWLQPSAALSTQGVALLQTNDLGERVGSVLNGGNISISANRGYLITAAGSSLDASGTAAEVNLALNAGVGGTTSATPTLIGSNGGTIALTAAEGMLLNGAVASRAGNAAGAAGGALDIMIDGNLHGGEPGGVGAAPIFLLNPREIVLGDAAPPVVGPQQPIPEQYNGMALVPTSLIAAGGFSALQLTAKNLFDAGGPVGTSAPVSTASIVFPQNTDLQLPASIRLDAPQITSVSGAQVVLQAAYVGLGYDDALGGAQTGYSASGGTGSLQVQANLVDLIGSLGLGGMSTSSIDSSGDIRFIGVQSAGPTPLPIAGTLVTEGSLLLQANQLYPTTLTQFDVSVAGAASNTLEILPGNGTAGAVLSAGGQLTLQADSIQQQGVLRAPFGQLILDAPQITLAAGSITSTSGAGLTIPFGSTQAGADWVYPLPQGQFNVYTQSGPPTKAVILQGNDINVAQGAKIDLSGGGDLQASEFVPGVGGTVDVLSNTNTASPGQFAILPLLSLPYAPYDPQSQAGFSYAPGSSLVLAAGGAVPAGIYAILPANYALLPGAYLVRPVSGYTDIAPGQSFSQLDGGTIVAGRFATAGTAIVSARTQGFDVLPGAAVENLAQYNLTSANSFFSTLASTSGTTAPQLPRDAGQLQFLAGQQLQFQGNLAVAAASGGRGAEVDISASQVEVTHGGAAAPGVVGLDAAQLNALGAQSLLLGGTRSADGGATEVTTGASSILVDPGVTLRGSEIMLTASTSLTLSDGAALDASGAAVTVPASYALNGDGAFLRVSTGAQTPIVRVDPNPDPAAGALTIDQGATLMATGSATLEASGSLQSQASYALPGGSLSFTASQISLGSAPAGTAGLVLSTAPLSALDLNALVLTSGSTMAIFGANALQVSGSVTLDAPGLSAASSDAALTLESGQIVLVGATAGSAGAAAAGPLSSGAITIQADHFILGGGTTTFSRFAGVTLAGASEIHAAAGGSISSDSALTLDTALLSTANGVSYQIGSTGGALQVQGALASSSSTPAAPGAGGALSLSGTAVTIDTAVSLPSGLLQIAAQGPVGADGIVLGAGASINLAGAAASFDTLAVAAPGGILSMDAAFGTVSMLPGAQINVSAGGAGGAAGALNITAPNGTAALQGSLSATGGSAGTAGQFTLDVLQLPDLAGLNATLNSGGFAGLRSFRQRGAGDVVLASSGAVNATTVAISNDGGSITVLGSIDASGPSGGSVSLTAENAVEIAGTINASASGNAQPGGSLQIASTAGVVQIDNLATINLAGGSGGAGGTLALSVPRASLNGLITPGAGSPAISLGGNIEGTQQVQVEGLATYNAAQDKVPNTISAADIATTGTWYRDAQGFMTNAVQIGAALQGTSALNVAIVPGIEIESTGNLSLNTAWDLSTWRFNGAAGILTLRAAGNLLIQHSLSDGFAGTTGSAAFVLPATPGPSWSYQLVAGADLAASNPMAVQPAGVLPAGSGSLLISAGTVDSGGRAPVPVMIRTGTGNIDIAAAGNLQFGNRASVIYTAGENSETGIPLSELSNLAYPTAGGNIAVDVEGNILGAPTNQLVTAWLWRAGQGPATASALSATGWTVNYQWFEENIGALGGGNVTVDAGGNISQLSVAVPSIGVQTGGTSFAQNAVEVTGGGTLSVQSGGNITGGSYYVGQGSGSIVADGSLAADTSGAANTTSLAPILALGESTLSVDARTGIALEGVLDPFLLPQGTAQSTNLRTQSLFSTYTEASTVSLLSAAGDVTLLNEPSIDGISKQLTSMRFSTPVQSEPFNLYPGTVNATALTGDLNLDGVLTLWPSPTGTLNLLAGENIVFAQQYNSEILMSGLNPATLPSPAAPVGSLTFAFNELFATPAPGVAQTPIHSAAYAPGGQNDPTPVRLVALDGSITDAFLAYIPKSVHLVAGQDITQLVLRVENIASTDVSVISAGNDISYASPRDVNGDFSSAGQSIIIEGPGSLLVEAGGNIDLGTSSGITTVGNLYNPALAPGGANVSVLAGATTERADLADFIALYLADSTTYDSELISYVQARTAAPVTSKSDALAIFTTLPQEQQFLLCQQIMYQEIVAGGRLAAAPGPQHANYSRAFLALSTLFPNSTTASGPDAATSVYPGSLSLYFSQIYTLEGGDVSLLAPGGSVNVGLATPPSAFGISKTPSELGIVAQSTGNVSSVSYGNFLVNQSRVFAADGGNILVWSTDGNVDAGRGAKTAISAPAPTITFNAQGQIQTVFPAALEGSGIQALATTAGVSPGDVDLYAPQGVVNASDAGIVAGNLTIGATAVLGRNNITVSGISVGVPVEATGLGASLAGAGSVGSSAATAATMAAEAGSKQDQQAAAPLAQSALEFLDVFVLGLGEDACKPEDLECLKRQKPN